MNSIYLIQILPDLKSFVCRNLLEKFCLQFFARKNMDIVCLYQAMGFQMTVYWKQITDWILDMSFQTLIFLNNPIYCSLQ